MGRPTQNPWLAVELAFVQITFNFGGLKGSALEVLWMCGSRTRLALEAYL